MDPKTADKILRAMAKDVFLVETTDQLAQGGGLGQSSLFNHKVRHDFNQRWDQPKSAGCALDLHWTGKCDWVIPDVGMSSAWHEAHCALK